MQYMFQSSGMNSDVHIKNLRYAHGAFSYTNNLQINVYIDGVDTTNASLYYAFYNTGSDYQKNIFINSQYENVVLNGSIIGSNPTWEPIGDGNGYFNSTYNIYVYNNYIPA
jgi:hypothetical protein